MTKQAGTAVGEYVPIGPSVQAALPKNELVEDEEQYPCALFHLDPAECDEGVYSIRVEFRPSRMKAEVPDFIKRANIESYQDGAETIYTYELREKITFSSFRKYFTKLVLSGLSRSMRSLGSTQIVFLGVNLLP